jgi:TRAP-type uncharacterized transport system substrate-binding protein
MPVILVIIAELNPFFTLRNTYPPITGVYLTGVYSMGIALIGVYFMGVYHINVYFMGVYSITHGFNRHSSHTHASHGHASHEVLGNFEKWPFLPIYPGLSRANEFGCEFRWPRVRGQCLGGPAPT